MIRARGRIDPDQSRRAGPGPLDVCVCGCDREDHGRNGRCRGDYGCRPPCTGFRLAMTAAEVARRAVQP